MKRRTLRKKLELAGGRLALRGILCMAKRLDPERIGRWGDRLGDFIFRASGRYRGVALRNLRAAYPEWTEEEVKHAARQVFRNFTRGGLEFFYLLKLPPGELDMWISVEGREHLDAALRKGRGVIAVTAHYGNWEFYARKIVLMGYPLNVIARDSDDPTMTGVVNTMRETAGYRVFPRDSSALPAMRCLKKNELVGILPDQNTLSGIFVEFFGRPAATATGPAVLALKSGAEVICGFARRNDDGSFTAQIYPPISIERTDDFDEDVRRLTAAITKAIEEQIRSDPTQWLWLHDRWKRESEAVEWKTPALLCHSEHSEESG